jgi:hypothetical protein
MRDPNRFVFILRDYDNDIVGYFHSLEGAIDYIYEKDPDLVCPLVDIEDTFQRAMFYTPLEDTNDTDDMAYVENGEIQYRIYETPVMP